jgi:hypothetical protein
MTKLSTLPPIFLALIFLHGCAIPISDPDLWPNNFVQKKDLPALVGKREQEVVNELGPPNSVVQRDQSISYLYEEYEDDTYIYTFLFIIPMPAPPVDALEASCVLLNFNKDGILTDYKIDTSGIDCSSALRINQYRHVDPRIYFAIKGDFEAIDQYQVYSSLPISDKSRLTYLCRAADMGHPYAQIEVGRNLAQGNYGITRDLRRAYVWYSLAAKSGFDTHRKVIMKEMSTDQIAESEQMFTSWKPGQCERDLLLIPASE